MDAKRIQDEKYCYSLYCSQPSEVMTVVFMCCWTLLHFKSFNIRICGEYAIGGKAQIVAMWVRAGHWCSPLQQHVLINIMHFVVMVHHDFYFKGFKNLFTFGFSLQPHVVFRSLWLSSHLRCLSDAHICHIHYVSCQINQFAWKTLGGENVPVSCRASSLLMGEHDIKKVNE